MADQGIQGLPEGATAVPISQSASPQIQGLPEGATAVPIQHAAPTPVPFSIPTPGLGTQHTVVPPTSSVPPPSDDPAITKAATPPQSQLDGALRGPGEEIQQTIKGVGDMGSQIGKIAQGDTNSPVRSALGKINPAGVALYDAASNLGHGVVDAVHKGASEDSIPGKILGTAENLPVVGDLVQKMEHGQGSEAVTQGLTRAALLKAPIPEAEAAEALPKSETIAGKELPITVGQAVTKANPESIVGPSLSGVENMTKNLPFTGGPLKAVGRAQQAGAREILAGKAAKTGAEVSSAPEAIEQNFTNAVDKAHEQGSAKYQAIADAADKADLSKSVNSASSILNDSELVKVLPKSAKDALGKVASSLTEQETTSRAIYGKAFGDLEDSQKAEVGKAMRGAPEPAGVSAVLKARSELASAANTTRDAADRYRLHGALDDFDGSLNEALAAHDKATGANTVADLSDAKKLWTQKYAFDNFKAGLQQVLRGQPAEGMREIPGQAFQRMVNKLDPAGGLKGSRTSTLQRMFPDDPQSVKDIHDLADFLGKHQSKAGGGLGGTMASMRVLGLKESAASLLAHATGFAYIMAHPGGAGIVLDALRAGKDTAKLSAAAGALNHLAEQAGANSDANQDPQRENVPNTGVDERLPVPSNPTKEATNQNATPPIQSKASATSTTMTPSSSLWKGKESKVLTLRGPDGKHHDWQLRNGTPAQVD